MKKNLEIYRFTFIIVLMAILSASCSAFGSSFKGMEYKPLKSAPEISMVDHNGRPFQLSSLRGKVTALFFGYVNCPDECPATMARLRQAVDLMGDEAKNVQVILVSTDPVRDTPQEMKNFLAKFNPTFLGIPGSAQDLAKIWDDYGVVVLDGGETHTSLIDVVDKNGKLRLKIDAESAPEEIASDLKTLLAQN